jgi:uncharacterized protein YqgV (UPF0045/DUF77 family)
MPEASVAFQVMPRTKDLNTTETIKIIDKVIDLVKKSNVTYEVGPMETTMEGELKELLKIVEDAQYLCIESGAEAVFTNVKISYNPQGILTIGEKVTKHR